MKIIIAALLLAMFMISCAATGLWHKDGVNENETETYLAQCEYDVSMNKLEGPEAQRTIDNCMKKNGFRKNNP